MRSPDDPKVWIGGGIAATLVILLAGYLLLVHPQLASASTQRADAAAARSQNASLSGRLAALAVENSKLPAYSGQLGRVLTQLPITDGITTYAEQLNTQAAMSQVAVKSLAVGSITASSISAAAAATTTDTTGSTTDTSTTAAAPAATPVTTTATAGTGTGSTVPGSTTTGTTTTGTAGVPVTSAAGSVFQIAYTVTTHGTLQQQQTFIRAIQDFGPRVALVKSLSFVPDSASQSATLDSSSDMTTELEVFVAPQSAAATALLDRQLRAKASP